ncbi:receptor protein kinase-like protein [Thioploca ingrica]|uniref:Receptor protein kinase-like protein n=1 Tax=Thioploca ingrica TaxID=40754 RepID=A0A090BUZ8_9GAMM|nr:receptor protein kinase-like protein [Thioploca ingrica]
MTPTEHAFGETNLGSALNPQVFTLTNAGNISLKSPTFELTGANPLEFTFAGWGCNYKNVLLPNEQESCELMAQFIPITPGDKQADLTIQSANAPALKVPLTGTAKIPESCANVTTESVNSGDWNDPATWSANAIPREFDNVRINANHTIRGANFATVNALCIADNGVLESPDNQGTSLILHATSYLENKGIIRGQNGADQLATATTCNGDYWSTIGTPDCAQPGASLILSVGHNSENLLNNEGVIIAGRGGSGQLHHAYGGNVSLLGNVIVNHVTDTGCGIIKAGDGSLATPASAAERPGVPARCLDLLNQLTNAANDSDTAAPANNGRAGKGGDLTLWADSGLYSQGPVQVLAGNGGNCTAAQTQGGNGGRLRFNARQRVDLSGGYFAAGRGSTNCPQNGNSGAVGIEPSVISLAGAGTRIEGGDITIFGGDDWVLDLSHLDAAAIQADGDITLAVGKNGIIDLRGNSATILKAGGQVKLFSDEVLLDGNVNLKQVIQAKNIVVGPNKILYDVSFLGASKFAAQPGSGLTIPLTLANNGPTVDTYTLTLTNPQGWMISEFPATLEVKELSTYELPLQVTLPETRGASNSITVTATSQADPTVTATANILVTVAMEAAVVNPEPEPVMIDPEQPVTVNPELVTLSPTVIVPMPTSNPCPDSGTINWLCDNRERTLTNATVAENASIAGGYLAGEIDNQGLISQVTIQPETTLTGGRLTGTIINQGTLANFNFVGARVVGGTLAGQIINTSQIEGYFQDVHLAADTQITGGQLAGQISGEVQTPAVLKQLAIKPGSHLEHLIIGDAVTFAADVTFGEGVQFQDPSQDPRLISSPTEEPTPPATVICDSELPALGVTATNSKGKAVETTAQAAGGAAVNSGSFEPTVSVQLTDTVEVRGTLCVEASQVGLAAEIVVYAHYQPMDSTQVSAHYMLDSEGQVQLWDGEWEHLVALKSTILESKQSVTLYQGVFPVTGEVALSFGYRLADGTMIANAKTIVVKIAP